jgi:predicted ATPase
MVDDFQGGYLIQPLNPQILSTPFKKKTNWHVITGAPCSGKTTIIELLAQKGYLTAHETAREYFEMEMVKGRSSQDIRDSGYTTQMGIFALQRDLENSLERGLPDTMTFNRLFRLDLKEVMLACFRHLYASVFILDRLPFAREVQLGPEDEKPAGFIDEWLERDYSSLGYQVVRVPVSSPEERLQFILDRLPESDKNT